MSISFAPKRLKIVLICLFVAFLLAVNGIFVNFYYSSKNTSEKNAQVSHTYQVIKEIDQEKILYFQAQGFLLNFLVSNKPWVEAWYYDKKNEVINNFQDIRNLISDNPAQQQRLAAIERLLTLRFNRYETTIWFYKNDIAKYSDVVAQPTGLELNKLIVEKLTEISQVEEDLLKERIALYEESKSNNSVLLYVLFASTVAILFSFLIAGFKLISLREKEAALSLANEKLGETVKRQTEELVDANRELEAFTHSVSHDLRAPLVAIGGFANLIESECGKHLDTDGKRYLWVIMDNISKMGQLITDLMDFSRLAQKELVRRETNMNNLFATVIDEVKGAYDAKFTVLVEDMGTDSVDIGVMRQAILNLVSNAFKFSHTREKPMVKIGTFIKDGEKVYFIKDNGVGFPMKMYDLLFTVFKRFHTDREFTGTGIGLSIVHRVIAKHGGRVWANSTENGAVFYFTTKSKNLNVVSA